MSYVVAEFVQERIHSDIAANEKANEHFDYHQAAKTARLIPALISRQSCRFLIQPIGATQRRSLPIKNVNSAIPTFTFDP